MLKTVVLLNIFVETILCILWFMESSKENHLFKIEAFSNITDLIFAIKK